MVGRPPWVDKDDGVSLNPDLLQDSTGHETIEERSSLTPLAVRLGQVHPRQQRVGGRPRRGRKQRPFSPGTDPPLRGPSPWDARAPPRGTAAQTCTHGTEVRSLQVRGNGPVGPSCDRSLVAVLRSPARSSKSPVLHPGGQSSTVPSRSPTLNRGDGCRRGFLSF